MTKIQKISYYLLLTLTSLLFIFSGLSKLTAIPEAVTSFQVAHLPIWFMYFIGTCEILGGIGLWFSVSSKSNLQKLARLAVYGLFIILIGAIVTTIIFVNPSEAFFPLLVGIILSIVFWLSQKQQTVIEQ